VKAPAGLTVSAIVPVYNGEADLAEALASIFAQDKLPDELILVDDGSVDRSRAIMDQAIADAPSSMVTRIIEQANAGQSAARNAACAVARGDLLAFLDQDDRWHPDHVRLLSGPFADDPTLGICYGDFDEIDGSGSFVVRGFIASHGVSHDRSSIVDWIETDTMIIPTATIVRASAFHQAGGFDPQLIGYEDDELWIRLFRAGWTSRFIARSVSSFRVHAGSSSRRETFRNSRVLFLRKVSRLLPDSPELRRYYITDVLLPRLLRATLDDYRAELRMGRNGEARAVARSLDALLEGTRSRYLSPAERWVLRHPSLARLLLRARRILFRPPDERFDPRRRVTGSLSSRM